VKLTFESICETDADEGMYALFKDGEAGSRIQCMPCNSGLSEVVLDIVETFI
jgi:hypothetical protein